jgi:hypothetical protein
VLKSPPIANLQTVTGSAWTLKAPKTIDSLKPEYEKNIIFGNHTLISYNFQLCTKARPGID